MADDHDMMVDAQEHHSIMDNIDDLFGDGGDDNLKFDNVDLREALAAALDSDALHQKVEDSHLVGCCQKLAWSKTGVVADISTDGRQIRFKTLVRDRNTAKWHLTDDGCQPIAAPRDAPFVHVEWSSTGLEFVATDRFGGLHLYSMASALNRLHPIPINRSATTDDLGQVTGLHWLPVNLAPKPITPVISPASKDGGRWSSTISFPSSSSVTHPLDGKAAFLYVTGRNQLRLVCQQPSHPWSETSIDLGELASSADILTHASFCDGPSNLLLATYDRSQRLRLFRVNILWNPTQGDNVHPPSVHPQLYVTRIQLLDHCMPQAPPKVAADQSSLGQVMTSAAELSHLSILQPSATSDNGTCTLTAVFTVMSDHSQMSQQSERFSVVSRWELRRTDVTLFDWKSDVSKPGHDRSAALKPREMLHRLDDVMIHKLILSATSSLYRDMVAFAFSDGTVEFRERDSMQIIMADGDATRASSLPQSGFSFLPSDCIEISLSAAGSLAVVKKPDGSIHLQSAEFIHGWQTPNRDLARAAIVSLARECAVVICHNLVPEDTLALIPDDLDQDLRHRFVAEVLRSIQRNTDYTSDDPKQAATMGNKVLKDSVLFKILSVQRCLGYGTEPSRPDIPGKMAWTMLNLRVVLSSFYHVIGSTQSADPLVALHGAVKYTLDLMTHILADLFAIMRVARKQSRPINATFIREQIAQTNTPSLHLVMHSASRSLLRTLCEMQGPFLRKVVHSKPSVTSLAQKNGLLEVENLFHMMPGGLLPFKPPHFDQLLIEIDNTVKRCYAEAKIRPAERSKVEQSMLVEGEVPEALTPVLESLFGKMLSTMEQRVDGAGIYFADTTWLGISDAPNARSRSGKVLGGEAFDVLRKEQLGRGAKKRRCRRCGSVTEDWDASRDGPMPAWMMVGSRNCVCLNHWFVV